MVNQANLVERNIQVAQRERDASKWGVYGSPLSDYEFSFSPVLGGKRIKDVAHEIRAQKGSLIALDFMGTGSPLTNLDITKGLSVGLTSGPNLQNSRIDSVEGDIVIDDTWVRINNWVSDNSKFDLILWRPVDGVNHIPNTFEFYIQLLSKLIINMNEKGDFLGDFFGLKREDLVRVLEWMRNLEGSFKYDEITKKFRYQK